MNRDSQWSKQEACIARATQVWLAVNHNTSVTSEFDVRSELHGQVSLQLSIKSRVVHEDMNSCKSLKIH